MVKRSLTVSRSLIASRAAAAVLATAIGGTAVGAAEAASSWRVRHGNGQFWAETASLAHGATLSLRCDDVNTSVALTLEPPASWNGNAGYRLKILVDGQDFAVVVDGTDDGVVLSNLPSEAIGIDRALRRAMKAGSQLVLEGPPAASIPAGQRSFSLAGAQAAITRIEASCPGVR